MTKMTDDVKVVSFRETIEIEGPRNEISNPYIFAFGMVRGLA